MKWKKYNHIKEIHLYRDLLVINLKARKQIHNQSENYNLKSITATVMKAKKHVRAANVTKEGGAPLIGTNPDDPSPSSGPNTAVVVIIVRVRLNEIQRRAKVRC